MTTSAARAVTGTLVGEKEEDYTFTTIDQLLDDFEREIANWR